eukprot:jgi/Chrzof1/14346/UNPLg00620.t1
MSKPSYNSPDCCRDMRHKKGSIDSFFKPLSSPAKTTKPAPGQQNHQPGSTKQAHKLAAAGDSEVHSNQQASQESTQPGIKPEHNSPGAARMFDKQQQRQDELSGAAGTIGQDGVASPGSAVKRKHGADDRSVKKKRAGGDSDVLDVAQPAVADATSQDIAAAADADNCIRNTDDNTRA